jgi:4-hydroxybenzoate polyprenyltransferase
MRMTRVWSYLELVHIYAAVAVFATTVVFCLLAYGGVPDIPLFLRVVGVVSLAQACVGITNELIDLPRDRQVKPDRPLVDGRANPTVALIIACSVGVGSLLLSLTFGWTGLFFGVLGLGSGLAYNFWFKGTALSWLPYVTGFSLLPLWPFAALDNWNEQLAWIWVPALPASIALNISQSLSDIEEDYEVGFGGITRRLGRKWSLLSLWAMCGLTIVLGIVTVTPANLNALFLGSVVVACGLIGVSAWRCHYHPGTSSWQLAWYLVTAAVCVMGAGWLNAVL